MENFFNDALEFGLFKKALRATDKEPVVLNLSSTDSSLQTNKEPAKVAYSTPRKNMSEKFEPSPFGKYFGSRKSKNTAVDMNDFSSWKNKNYRKVEEEANASENLESSKPFSLSEYLKNKSAQKYNELDQAKTDLKKPITQLSTDDPDYKKFSLDSYMHKLEEDVISKNKFEENDDLLEPIGREEDVMPTTNQDEDFTRSNVDLDEDAFDDIGPGEKFSLDRSELDEVKKRLDRIERESANIKEKTNQGVITGDELKDSLEEEERTSITKVFTDPLNVNEDDEEDKSDESTEETSGGEKRYYEVNMNEDSPRKRRNATNLSEPDEQGEFSEDEELFKSEDLVDDYDNTQADEDEVLDEQGDDESETSSEELETGDEETETTSDESESTIDESEDASSEKDADENKDDFGLDENDVDFESPYDDDEDYFDGYDSSLKPANPKKSVESEEDDFDVDFDEDLAEEPVQKPEKNVAKKPKAVSKKAVNKPEPVEPEPEPVEPEPSEPEEIKKTAVEEELETKIAELTERSKKADEEANERLKRIQEEKDRDYQEYQARLRGMEESYNKRYEEIREKMLLDRLSNERKLDEFHSRLKIKESEIREQQLKPAANMKQISMMLSKELKSNHNISNLESDNKLLQISNKIKKQEEKKNRELDAALEVGDGAKKSSTRSKAKANIDVSAPAPKKRRRRGKSRRRIDSDIIGTIDFD